MADSRASCQVIYDAGSSGTRLFVYAKRDDKWVEHQGPRTVALADPVREMRGKTNADIEAVTTEVVAQVDRLLVAGPQDDKGIPAWPAFDWKTQCRVTDAMVFATGGMRLAEQQAPAMSRLLWRSLAAKLQAKFGPDTWVTARTVTGAEEGVYAWLAVRQQRPDMRFGIAEMGGASTQVTFPCSGCDTADEAVHTVKVDGRAVTMFSHSFLGLGQDEAPKIMGLPAACGYGVGARQAGWQRQECSDKILIATPSGLRDPLNFSPSGERGASRNVPTAKADVDGWVLTGAFNFMTDTAVASCCATAGKCFQPETSCFRAVYLEKYLDHLAIPANSQKRSVSWTMGAAICNESSCMAPSSQAVCRWSATGCI